MNNYITLFDFLVELATNTALQRVMADMTKYDKIKTFLMDGDGLGDYTGGTFLSKEDAEIAANSYTNKTNKRDLKKRLLSQIGFFIVEDNFHVVYQLTGTVRKDAATRDYPPPPIEDGCFRPAESEYVAFKQANDKSLQPLSTTLIPLSVYHVNHETGETIPVLVKKDGIKDPIEKPFVSRYLSGKMCFASDCKCEECEEKQ